MMKKILKLMYDNRDKIGAFVAGAIAVITPLLLGSCVMGDKAVDVLGECINGVCEKQF